MISLSACLYYAFQEEIPNYCHKRLNERCDAAASIELRVTSHKADERKAKMLMKEDLWAKHLSRSIMGCDGALQQ